MEAIRSLWSWARLVLCSEDPVSKRTNILGNGGGVPLYPSTWGAEEFEASLEYRMNFRTAKNIQRKICLKKQIKLTTQNFTCFWYKVALGVGLQGVSSEDLPLTIGTQVLCQVVTSLVFSLFWSLTTLLPDVFHDLVLHIFLGRIHVYCFFRSLKYVRLNLNEELLGLWVGRSFLGTMLTPRPLNWEGRSTQLGRACWGYSQHRLRRVPHRWTAQVFDPGTWGWSL